MRTIEEIQEKIRWNTSYIKSLTREINDKEMEVERLKELLEG